MASAQGSFSVEMFKLLLKLGWKSAAEKKGGEQ